MAGAIFRQPTGKRWVPRLRYWRSPLQAESELHTVSRELYEERLRRGVAREQARKDLPLSTYTEAYWKIDLHNLFHFLMLRMDSHAQLEIRSYANVIGNEIVSRWCPIAWEAFVDYRLKSAAPTRYDVEIVRALVGGKNEQAIALAREFGLVPADGSPMKASRERSELEAKLLNLGFAVPWADRSDPGAGFPSSAS